MNYSVPSVGAKKVVSSENFALHRLTSTLMSGGPVESLTVV
jgi:hypothetical protein